MRDYLRKNDSLRFVFPIDGDCVNERDGTSERGAVLINVKVSAPEGHTVTVCGEKAEWKDGFYTVPVEIFGHRTILTAKDESTGDECRIAVYYLPNSVGGYRISSDDNILFLADITYHKDEYKSIFDNPYLAVYKKAHDLYGAKVHINLFYEFKGEAKKFFSADRPDFDLSMMTDKFKDEWKANSDWLRLSFHSKNEKPDAPYQNATAEEVSRDCIRVNREILRFAGPEVMSDVTTLHWGAANETVVKTMREMGYRAMTGYFMHFSSAPVAYHAPYELIEHIFDRDFWYDSDNDMFFGRIDNVVNGSTNEKNMAEIAEIIKSPTRGGFVSILMHEQYFYDDYSHHRTDFEARILDPSRLLWEKGYKGRLISEVIAERHVHEFPLDMTEHLSL